MTNSAQNGYWESASENGGNDYMYIDSDTGRVVLKINYDHGAFLMKLWFESAEADIYNARLNPESEAQQFEMKLDGDSLITTHSDLNVPSATMNRIDEASAPADFRKDVAWANRTMDTVERNLAKKKQKKK